ncbi:MAG: EamA family transporter [Candidatus Nomurabacteria bacterium]|nr:EamA family transporter [Candidatus Nomurabacteria bacterium]
MLKNNNKNWGPYLIVVAAFLWGIDGILRRMFAGIPPITIIFFEHTIGAIILLPFAWSVASKEKVSNKDFGYLILVSLLSGLLGTLWFTTALLQTSFISFSVVFLLQKLQPIFAITTSSLILKEKFEKSYVKWAVLAVVSAYFVTFKNGYINWHTGQDTMIAALYALGAAFAWGTSTTFSKIILKNISAKTSTIYRFLFTALFSFIVMFFVGNCPSLTVVTPLQYGTFVLIALSSGMVGLLIYYYGLKNTSVHASTILELFYPLVAVLIGIFIYHDVLSLSQYVAGIVLCFAIYKIATINKKIQVTKEIK